jgi:uncharacterized protein (DUF2267 family)
MRFEDFVKRVQEQANLSTREDSERITKAVLQTLGERLDRKVRNGVLAQLPDELKDFLLASGKDSDQYNLAEFYNRVGARADLKYQDATERTQQVFAVLQQAIPEGEKQDILESLPGEFEELFGVERPIS